MNYYEYNSGPYKVILFIDKYKAKIEIYINETLVAENKLVGHLYKANDWIDKNKRTAKKVLHDVQKYKNNADVYGTLYFFWNPAE